MSLTIGGAVAIGVDTTITTVPLLAVIAGADIHVAASDYLIGSGISHCDSPVSVL